jgi:hypothetical protein
VPVPPTAPALRDSAVVPSREVSLYKGCPSGGGGGNIYQSSKERQENVMMISYETNMIPEGHKHTG